MYFASALKSPEVETFFNPSPPKLFNIEKTVSQLASR